MTRNSLQNATVAVIGDIMLDRYVTGDAVRLSPEAPVPVLSNTTTRAVLGGAGNVLANLRGLGVRVHLAGVVGDDADAGTLRAMMADIGADAAGLLVATDRPTIVKTRFMAGNHHLLRLDAEEARPVGDDVAARLIAQVQAALKNGARALILSDYGKGTLTPAVIAGVIDAAKASNVPVLVDPKGRDYSIYRGASIVTPNRKELAEATANMPNATDGDIVVAARHLIKTSGIDCVIATRSQDGMSVVRADGTPLHLRAQARAVFDVSGAGDTVIATIAAGLAAGMDLDDAAHLANRAAGIVVGKVGTAPIMMDELESGDAISDMIAPVCDNWDDAARIVEGWRAQGLKIGFTNGAFDILHPGHVTYLAQARSRCDRLVVALNCDDSIRRYKSKDRPINDESSRAQVLAALGAVDLVVIFGRTAEEDDKAELVIRRINPDVLVKGADYEGKHVDGADYVQSRGGVVWLAPVVAGKSTTAIVKKLQGQGS
ncbi:D-glycero-beta-D-manno-heptose-7-phosphate kinase [Micavibrio aeruginosavorus]|uniref:D-glycero-beta-D-manno-heptose-7-phosphate kinase n=1 Tax=Micavibrio aeruginosavorus TaxID=349221 RepID=UPI003F4AF230